MLKRLGDRYHRHLIERARDGQRLPLIEIEVQALPWFMPLGIVGIVALLIDASPPAWLIMTTCALAIGGALYTGFVIASAWQDARISRDLEANRVEEPSKLP